MSENFDNTQFGANRATIGAVAFNPLNGVSTFTGTSAVSGLSTVTINGPIDRPNSQVSIDLNVGSLVGAGLPGTYLGFSQPSPNVEPVYYFSVTPLGLPTPIVVAVSNGTVPTVAVGTTVNRTNVTAPDSPTIVCFATGTRIRTPKGDVRVEDLNVGDTVVTASGAQRPVRWIGRRTIACEGRSDLARVLPVRIARDAFGEGRPARDLLVSPAHAICVDLLGEVLVPACHLINGTTITQVAVAEITYWHVELDSHDILLAENLPAESYIECGNRGFFANADVTEAAATPDARPSGREAYCRPLCENGALVEALRERLSERAATLGWTLSETTPAKLRLVA